MKAGFPSTGSGQALGGDDGDRSVTFGRKRPVSDRPLRQKGWELEEIE